MSTECYRVSFNIDKINANPIFSEYTAYVYSDYSQTILKTKFRKWLWHIKKIRNFDVLKRGL
jgi:hypothetical protein